MIENTINKPNNDKRESTNPFLLGIKKKDNPVEEEIDGLLTPKSNIMNLEGMTKLAEISGGNLKSQKRIEMYYNSSELNSNKMISDNKIKSPDETSIKNLSLIHI